MTTKPSRLPPTGEELVDALRHFFHDRAVPNGTDSANAELALFQLQKLVTLGQLASEVAHEFGNLTTVMLGYTELLQAWNERPADGSSDHPEHEYLSELHRAAERASALTTQLLCYSRQTVGTPAPLDLSASVRTLRALLIRVLGPQIQLSVSAREIGRLVLADARQVEQALVNLALNARDALPTGGHVEIAVEPLRLTEPLDGSLGDAPDGDYVRVRVCDDGCGMNAETKAQLFRPFFTTKDRGTGLGLTIVARIARQCGAAITVESEPDRGTTFALYFPILSEQQTR